MKCPCCGYDSLDKRDYDTMSKSLISKRDSRTEKMLIYVIKRIAKTEAIHKKELYYFFQSISNISDLAVYNALISYDNSNPYQSSKGLNYLKAIIKNYDKIMSKQKDSIERRLGSRAEEFPDEHKTKQE